jgi:hypothetical protein
MLYINGRKTLSKTYLKRMGEQGLAVWYGDDGCLLQHKDKNGMYGNPMSELATDSFSKEENELIVMWIDEIFDIQGFVIEKRDKRRNNINYRIRFGVENTKKLLTLVYPQLSSIVCLNHKILPKKENYFDVNSPKN